MPRALAVRYARALADLVLEPGSGAEPGAVTAEIESFAQAIVACPDLGLALGSPMVPPARKRAVVGRLAQSLPLSSLVSRFLYVLIDHRRTELIGDVREAFEAVVDERLGIVRADVASARELTPAERERILASLARLTGRQARARFRVERGLIGGAMARIGSTVYDGSVRGQLQGLKQRLVGVAS
jgi:F-type H+-transporting ATPase subunit delta